MKIASGLFWLVAGTWIVTVLPSVLLGIILLQVPLWPSFGERSTAEDFAAWALVTGWYYLTPLALITIRALNARPGSDAPAERAQPASVATLPIERFMGSRQAPNLLHGAPPTRYQPRGHGGTAKAPDRANPLRIVPGTAAR